MRVATNKKINVETKNPERRGLRKGVYLIPSAFTAANIGMGFYAVMAAVRGFQFVGKGTSADFLQASVYLDNAAKAIGWAVLFDMLDGRLARMTKTTTEIGIQLDSIADVVTFGLAPAVLAYVWGYGATLEEGGGLHNLAWFLSFMYLMCGAFRLARCGHASWPKVPSRRIKRVLLDYRSQSLVVSLPPLSTSRLYRWRDMEASERKSIQFC